MEEARRHLRSWLGPAILLAALIGMFGLSSAALAHGGHDCGKAAAGPKGGAGVVADVGATVTTAIEHPISGGGVAEVIDVPAS